jgi:hypothetical protein
VILTFIPANSGGDVVALIAVAAVALFALWLRRGGGGVATTPSLPQPPPADDPDFDADDDDGVETDDAAAVTVDGLAFIGEEHGVSLVPTPDPHEPVPTKIVPVEFLRPGDFSAARVARGAPSVDPWRLELLGPEGEYVSFGFELEDAARAALELLETRAVMHYVTDDDGRPLMPSSEQFDEAKRRADETERLLALGDAEGDAPLQ